MYVPSQLELIKVTSLLSYIFFRKHFLFLSSYALKSNLLALRFHFYKFAEKAKECDILAAILVNFKASNLVLVPAVPTSHGLEPNWHL